VLSFSVMLQSVTLFNALLISTEKTGVYVLIIQVLDVTDA
jgi:hypothetical protein